MLNNYKKFVYYLNKHLTTDKNNKNKNKEKT